LNAASFCGVAIERDTFGTFRLKPLRVVHRHGNVIAERLQDSQLLQRKSVQFWMGRSKHTDYALAHAQRDRDFRERGVSAANVIRIFAHVRRIAQLAGGRDMTYHPLLSNLQAVSLGM
jgi:predicted DNA-binding transcriptional regulator YafY